MGSVTNIRARAAAISDRPHRAHRGHRCECAGEVEALRAKVADRKASILADTGHARREIDHAQESIGKTFPQAAELAQARERARGIDEQLAKMAAPPQADARSSTQPAPAEPEGQQWFERSRGLDSREALRPESAPQAEPQATTASPGRAPDAGHGGRSWQPRDLDARQPGDVQPSAAPAVAEPAERSRPWWERTRGLEPAGHNPQPGNGAASPGRPEADRAWHPHEMPEARQADVPPGPAPAGPESQRWFERARGGLDPGHRDA